jgi:hypothetical protein
MQCEAPPIALTALVASRREQLQRINDAGLVAQGRVFLLSLEPIKLQIGLKWPLRSEVIWDAVERALAKAMPSPDVFVRLNDTSVLVAVASADSYEGQVRCVEVLKSLLSYFLGRSADADIALSRIANMEGDTLSADPIDIGAPAPTAPTPGPRAVTKRSPEDWTPPLTDRRDTGSISLTYYGHTEYRIEVVPVWRLDQDTISSYAIQLTLPAGVDRLSDLDHETLSHLTIGHVLPILQDYRREGGSFALIVPIAFSTLSARRPRMALLNRCAPLQDIMRRAVVAELSDLHAGVPSGLIRETVSMIRPFFRVVAATVRTSDDVSALYREAAFHGVGVVWRPGHSAGLERVVKAARRRTPNVILHRVPAGVSADELRRYHASHVTWNESQIND